MEQQYTPAIAAATTGYGQNLQSEIAALPGQQAQQQAAAQAALTAGTGTAPQVAPAALGNVGISNQVNTITQGLLNNPGALPPDVYDYVVRASAANAGQAGLLGGQGANNITAKQLGLTSNNLLQQNLGIGQSVGAQQSALATAQQQMLNQIGTINANLTQSGQQLATGTGFNYANRTLPGTSAMNAIFSTPLPASGLSPSNIASLAATNNQNQNQYNLASAQAQAQQANANMGFLGQIGGAVGSLFGSSAGGTSAAGNLLNGANSALGSIFGNLIA